MSEGNELYMLIHTYRNMMDDFAKEYEEDHEYIRGYFDALDRMLELVDNYNKGKNNES